MVSTLATAAQADIKFHVEVPPLKPADGPCKSLKYSYEINSKILIRDISEAEIVFSKVMPTDVKLFRERESLVADQLFLK